MIFETFRIAYGARGEGQDVVRVEQREPTSALVVLADGAGGSSGGRATAERAVAHTLESAPSAQRVLELAVELESADAGSTTLVALQLKNDFIEGVSVGDSEAVLITPTATQTLTEQQVRKPLLGQGIPRVANFAVSFPFGSTVLVASDGLWKYASRERVIELVRARGPLPRLAEALITLARLPNGALHDDVSIALVRRSDEPLELVEDLRAIAARDRPSLRFTPQLSDWMSWLLPRSSDGSTVVNSGLVGDEVRVTGWIAHVETQRWWPYRLSVRLTDPMWWRLEYATNETCESGTDFLELDHPREWTNVITSV